MRRGRLGIGATCAGNHTQVYGFEELCRSAYTRRWLRETCSVTNDTMLMTDMNGLTREIVAPYAEAGIRNLLWSPNQWNPLPSTLVPYDKSFVDYHWNPDAGGGGSRMDVRWKSSIPMLLKKTSFWAGLSARGKQRYFRTASDSASAARHARGVSPSFPQNKGCARMGLAKAAACLPASDASKGPCVRSPYRNRMSPGWLSGKLVFQ